MCERTTVVTKAVKVLANETRLRLLFALIEGEKSVSELAELLGTRQPILSQQLARLRRENAVQTRREAKRIYYSLADSELKSIVRYLYEVYAK